MTARFFILASTLVLFTGCASQRHRISGVQPVQAGISQLDWLVGTWEPLSGSGATEVWAVPEATTMRGFNFATEAGRVADFEILSIEADAGSLVYLARPNGSLPATAFVLVEMGAMSATFANPEHDFPQRVGYVRRGDVLTGWIEGPWIAGTKRAEWKWKRR